MDPTLEPMMRSGRTPLSSSALSTPMCAKPRGPPEPSTSATRGGVAGCTKRGSLSLETSPAPPHPARTRLATSAAARDPALTARPGATSGTSRCRPVDDDRGIDVHRVAREGERVLLADRDAALLGHASLDEAARGLVERARKVQERSALERTEARVEVVEALVGELEDHDLDREALGEDLARGRDRAMAMGHPQALGAAIEERVPGALERDIARHERDFVAAVGEPVGEIRLLVLALRIAEA